MSIIKAELKECFQTFTRADWQEFDGFREAAYAPTQPEVDAGNLDLLKETRQKLLGYFSSHGVNVGTVSQDTSITKQILNTAWNQFEVNQYGRQFQALVPSSKFTGFIDNFTLQNYNTDGTPKSSASEYNALCSIFQELKKKVE